MNQRTVWITAALICLPLMVVSPSSVMDGSRASPQQAKVKMVEIEIEEEITSVDISFDGSHETNLTCSAELLLDLGIVFDYVELFLTYESQDHVKVVLPGGKIRLNAERKIFHFQANITVDSGVLASNDPEVIISGTVKGYPGGTEGSVVPDSATVDILPYYGSNCYFEETTASLNTGEEVTFVLIIENTGNIGENFIVEIVNRESLSKKGILVSMETGSVYVDTEEPDRVDVVVKASADADRGSYRIDVSCSSEEEPGSRDAISNASLTINVDNKVVGFLRDFFRSPGYLYGTGIALLIFLALAAYGLVRLKRYISWRRRIEEAAKRMSTHDKTLATEEPHDEDVSH